MKKVIWIVVVVLVVLFISGSCSAYNRMVTAEETVNTTWADVEAQYQRRSDLIPNLVSTAKGYAAPAPQNIQDKHFLRKHGPNAYYGQK